MSLLTILSHLVWVQLGPSWSQLGVGPTWVTLIFRTIGSQFALNLGPICGNLGHFVANLDWPEPIWPQLRPSWDQLEPTWVSLEPTWGQLWSNWNRTILIPSWTQLKPICWSIQPHCCCNPPYQAANQVAHRPKGSELQGCMQAWNGKNQVVHNLFSLRVEGWNHLQNTWTIYYFLIDFVTIVHRFWLLLGPRSSFWRCCWRLGPTWPPPFISERDMISVSLR